MKRTLLIAMIIVVGCGAIAALRTSADAVTLGHVRLTLSVATAALPGAHHKSPKRHTLQFTGSTDIRAPSTFKT